jgi:hypothetical protein
MYRVRRRVFILSHASAVRGVDCFDIDCLGDQFIRYNVPPMPILRNDQVWATGVGRSVFLREAIRR